MLQLHYTWGKFIGHYVLDIGLLFAADAAVSLIEQVLEYLLSFTTSPSRPHSCLS